MLHQDLVPAECQFLYAGRGKANAGLLILDFLRYAYEHGCLLIFVTALFYSSSFSTLVSLPNSSSICFFSKTRGGDSAMMSPVTRIRIPSAKAFLNAA
ncbi:hypothetical protein D3C85_1747290 [compost metagenome]